LINVCDADRALRHIICLTSVTLQLSFLNYQKISSE